MLCFTEVPTPAFPPGLLESAHDAIICIDPAGRITAWNDSARRVFGYDAADVIGRDVSVLVPPDDTGDTASRLRTPASEFAQPPDLTLVTKDGRMVDLSVATSPIRDAAGTVVGASIICRSMEDRRRLAVAALHLGAVVASSDDVIISKDLTGTVQSWNPAAQRLFGFTADEMIGQSIRKIIPAERQSEEDDVLAKIRAGMIVDHLKRCGRRRTAGGSTSR
jgi:two-component system, OmpR family, sensor histidine kinase VicK